MRKAKQAVLLRNKFRIYHRGGYRLSQRLDGGLLGVYTARHIGPTGLARIAFRALLGTIRHDRDFIAFTAKRLTVERKGRIHVSLDGEVCRLTGPLRYSIVPGAIRVLAPDVDRGVEE